MRLFIFVGSVFMEENKMIFPFGAAVAASSMLRKNNETEPSQNKNEPPQSKFVIMVNDETTRIHHDVANEFDWARAAWAMIKACKQKGQAENLKKILDEEREGF